MAYGLDLAWSLGVQAFVVLGKWEPESLLSMVRVFCFFILFRVVNSVWVGLSQTRYPGQSEGFFIMVIMIKSWLDPDMARLRVSPSVRSAKARLGSAGGRAKFYLAGGKIFAIADKVGTILAFSLSLSYAIKTFFMSKKHILYANLVKICRSFGKTPWAGSHILTIKGAFKLSPRDLSPPRPGLIFFIEGENDGSRSKRMKEGYGEKLGQAPVEQLVSDS
jgi:hypothetical protein